MKTLAVKSAILIAMVTGAGGAHAQAWTQLKPISVASVTSGVVNVTFDHQNRAFYFDIKALTVTSDPATSRALGIMWTEMLLNACRAGTPLWIQSDTEAAGQRISGVAEGPTKPR